MVDVVEERHDLVLQILVRGMDGVTRVLYGWG